MMPLQHRPIDDEEIVKLRTQLICYKLLQIFPEVLRYGTEFAEKKADIRVLHRCG